MRFQSVMVIAVVALLSLSALSRPQDSQVRGQAAVTRVPGLSAALAELPTGQAVAIYENSELTIVAQRAALIDVLRDASSQIGAELEAPSDANEPVLGVFGPGPARQVLTSLLNGLQYEFGTAGSATEPNALVRIVVFRRSKSSDSPRQDNKPASALNTIADPLIQSQEDSASIGEKANVQQMLELLGEAKVNFVDNEVDPDDPTSGVVKAQTGDIFKALESLVKTAAIEEARFPKPSTITPRAGNIASEGSAVPTRQIRRRR